ncbi:hypothetical protein [Klebsiella phage vB_KpnS-VAC35]|uniref:Uncharacterized protein n=1 Tax=Klebsiella phage vB_KpnS-VAC35 TaxID=2866696 RepID=A0AAE8YDI7_9CAUD|nr:hypothetical protein [Klebsiella phage vB_KpnS-VAC35]
MKFQEIFYIRRIEDFDPQLPFVRDNVHFRQPFEYVQIRQSTSCVQIRPCFCVQEQCANPIIVLLCANPTIARSVEMLDFFNI